MTNTFNIVAYGLVMAGLGVLLGFIIWGGN